MRKPRLLPLHPDTVIALREQVAGKKPSAPVFDDLPTCETFKRDVRAAKLDLDTRDGVLTMTSLRKAFASDLGRNGVSDAIRMKLMRHGSMEMTDGTYTRYDLGEMAENVGRLSLLPSARRDEFEARTAARGGRGLPVNHFRFRPVRASR